MNIIEFNQAPEQTATELLLNAAHIPFWVEHVIAHRPYSSKEEFIAFSEAFFNQVQWADIIEALNKHPKLGEKKAKSELTQSEQALSKSEQSSMNLSSKTEQALVELNQQYQKQFGFIFLTKAKGKSAEDILLEIKYRLSHSLEQEKAVVLSELKKITVLRLSQLIID